jgi:LmbE family N-acetylglucosaminyl deacetylase
MEIGCAGTLKRFQDQGAKIISVITVCPSAEDNPKRNQQIVEQELKTSYLLSGFECKILPTGRHPNGRPNLVADNVTMTELSSLLEPCDIAIIPHPDDYHQDHRHTYELAWPLVKKLAQQVWLMHVTPYCYHHTSSPANLFYNIEHQWEFKENLLKCYSSYFDQDQINKIKIINQFWGARNNADLCEAFSLVTKYVK